jgi:outer membrane autotransporter protein
LRPEVSLYTALPSLAQLYGRALIGTLHDRVGEEEQLRGRSKDTDDLFNGAWVRAIGWDGHRNGDSAGIYGADGPKFDYDLYALQTGTDIYRHENDDGIRDHAGVMAAYGRAEANVTHFNEVSAGKDTIDVYSLGGYWTRFRPDDAYLDAAANFSWYDATAQSTRQNLQLDGTAWGSVLSLEGGKPFDLNAHWLIEPQTQIVYQHFTADDSSDAAATVRFQDTDSFLGRLGLRLARNWSHASASGEERKSTAWGRVNVWHEFLDSPVTSFSSEDGFVPFTSDIGGTWIETQAGTTLQMSKTGALYADVGYQWNTDNQGDAVSVRAGVRFNW